MADVGSGAGLPIIPCLIARPGIQATLIESSPKKAVFLREALRLVGAHHTAKVIVERFEKTTTPQVEFITCRALDRFEEMFGKLLGWSPPESTLVALRRPQHPAADRTKRFAYTAVLIPESEQRFLLVVERNACRAMISAND